MEPARQYLREIGFVKSEKELELLRSQGKKPLGYDQLELAPMRAATLLDPHKTAMILDYLRMHMSPARFHRAVACDGDISFYETVLENFIRDDYGTSFNTHQSEGVARVLSTAIEHCIGLGPELGIFLYSLMDRLSKAPLLASEILEYVIQEMPQRVFQFLLKDAPMLETGMFFVSYFGGALLFGFDMRSFKAKHVKKFARAFDLAIQRTPNDLLLKYHMYDPEEKRYRPFPGLIDRILFDHVLFSSRRDWKNSLLREWMAHSILKHIGPMVYHRDMERAVNIREYAGQVIKAAARGDATDWKVHHPLPPFVSEFALF